MPKNPTPWPLTVPVLTGRDIYRGDFTSPDGCRHCLHGWAAVTFDSWATQAQAIHVIQSELMSVDIVRFNDDPSVPKSKVAAVWNRAMRELGYTEMV